MATLTLIFLLAFTACAYATPQPLISDAKMFDCRRSIQSCTGKVCLTDSQASNWATHAYQCLDTCDTATDPNFVPVGPNDCKLPADLAASNGDCTTAPSKCENGGTCKKMSDNTETCFCSNDYTGDTCQLPRILIDCETKASSANKMIVVVRPYIDAAAAATFSGKVYAADHLDNINCNFGPTTADANIYQTSPVPTASESNAYELQFDMPTTSGSTSTCGVLYTEGTTNPDKEYKVSIVIQYHELYTTSIDQVLELKCTQPISGDMMAEVGEKLDLTPASNLESSVVEQQNFPIVFTIVKADGTSALDPTTSVGTPIRLKFVGTFTNSGFNTFMVKSCKANNGITTSTAASVELVDLNGCPGTDRTVIPFDGAHVVDAGDPHTTVQIPFNAFMFLEGSEGAAKGNVFVTCTVALCTTANKAQCKKDPGTCANNLPEAAYGRKKRAAELDTSGTKEVVMGQVISVSMAGPGKINMTVGNVKGAGNAGNAGAQGAMDKANACLQNPQMQTVLAVLGLLLVLAVVALTATAVLYCRGRGNQDSRLKYVDNYAMGSSTQTLAMPKI